MRLAYLILAHNTPNHLCRLVRALNSPNAVFFIHVDRKSTIRSYRDSLSQPKVTFLEDRVDVYWDGFSRVDATIKLINESLNCSPESGYLVLLSASDYPLRSPTYIEDFSRPQTSVPGLLFPSVQTSASVRTRSLAKCLARPGREACRQTIQDYTRRRYAWDLVSRLTTDITQVR